MKKLKLLSLLLFMQLFGFSLLARKQKNQKKFLKLVLKSGHVWSIFMATKSL